MMGMEVYLHSFVTSALNGEEWPVPLTDRLKYAENGPSAAVYKRLSGPRGRSGLFVERFLVPCWESEHKSPGFQVVFYSLYEMGCYGSHRQTLQMEKGLLSDYARNNYVILRNIIRINRYRIPRK
jgi:hypothetical protein